MIIGNELGITELPHELSNDLRLAILGTCNLRDTPRGGASCPHKKKKEKKTCNLRDLGNTRKISKLRPKIKILSILAKTPEN